MMDLGDASVHIVETGDPDAPPVLFLHGWPESWFSWRSLMSLANEGYHALAIDLPGIGRYTAGAVSAFAFNKPIVFMDTNIRRVFIHEFFQEREKIDDVEIIPLVEKTLDNINPRKWYNALMDYGSMLKKEQGNANKRSAHYSRQSPFENSNRQVRGNILRVLLKDSLLSISQLVLKTGMGADRVKKNIALLAKEGFVKKKEKLYYI